MDQSAYAWSMHIALGDLSDPQVMALLNEHLAGVAEHSPPESVHALNLDGLRATDITFWAVWNSTDDSTAEVIACGFLKQLDPTHGEIKSMRTAHNHLRKGVAAALLAHMINEARGRGYRRLSLETGSGAAFEPAHRLYQKFGFMLCEPFGDYPRDDPFSRFMTVELGS